MTTIHNKDVTLLPVLIFYLVVNSSSILAISPMSFSALALKGTTDSSSHSHTKVLTFVAVLDLESLFSGVTDTTVSTFPFLSC